MKIAEHNVLTLDYWKDEVSYEGITLPSGSIGCAALNISDAVIAELKQICQPLQTVIDAVGRCKLKPEQLAPTGNCVLQILALLQKENAFPFLDYPYYIKRITRKAHGAEKLADLFLQTHVRKVLLDPCDILIGQEKRFRLQIDHGCVLLIVFFYKSNALVFLNFNTAVQQLLSRSGRQIGSRLLESDFHMQTAIPSTTIRMSATIIPGTMLPSFRTESKPHGCSGRLTNSAIVSRHFWKNATRSV